LRPGSEFFFAIKQHEVCDAIGFCHYWIEIFFGL
jgi:hypothetical protein